MTRVCWTRIAFGVPFSSSPTTTRSRFDTRRKKRGEIGSGPATFGASGGVCGSTCGGHGSDTVRAPGRTRDRERSRAEPEKERPPAQRRCSIGTSVADRGSSLTGLYVMPSNFAK